jgi:hypothetical protein
MDQESTENSSIALGSTPTWANLHLDTNEGSVAMLESLYTSDLILFPPLRAAQEGSTPKAVNGEKSQKQDYPNKSFDSNSLCYRCTKLKGNHL